MPSFISNGGEWKAVKEKAVNIHTGEIYEGPDREAEAMIKEAGGRMGMKATEDPENIMRARQLNMSVEDYLKLGAPPEEIVKKAEEKKKNMVQDHKQSDAKAKPGVKPQGGGVDMKGNFGQPPKV